jgi:hypothetical protein
MGHSSPPDSRGPNGGSVSGLTVIVGLVLLVIAGTGFAVATYLAMGPVSLRHQAIARAVAEGEQMEDAASDDLAGAATGTSGGEMPPSAGAHRASPSETAKHPAGSSGTPSSTTGGGPNAGAMGDAGQLPGRELDSSGLSLTQLSPLEIVGTGANAGDWRGAVTSGGLIFGHAVLLRPAQEQGVAQIAFALKARFVRFRGFAATVGGETRDATGAGGDQPQAVFRVYGDGNLLWESEPLLGLGKRQAFECNITGVDVLTLVAESQSPASISNFAWGDPILLSGEKTGLEVQPRLPKTP